MQTIRRTLLFLLVFLLAFSFSSIAEQNTTSLEGLVVQSEEKLVYATGFSITHYQSGFASFTLDAHPNQVFLLVPEGQLPPEGLSENVVVLRQPMGHITFNSTGMVSLVDAIGGLDHIASVGTDLKGWYLDNVITKMKAGEISFSGNYKAPDFETLTKAGVQLVIDTVRLAENPEVIAKYDELGIPWMIESSSKEGHPLGRVEWVKLFGTLIGMKEESDRYFSQQAEKVAQVKSADATGKTVAMVYMSSDGSKVFCRNGGDYMASMINLAGGEYIMKDLEPGKTGTTSVTMEAFYAACKDADYLFYVNHVQKFKTLEDMVAFNPLFADLKAVKEGQVYITSPDFSQSTAAIAGIIADMHAVLSNASIESTHALNKLQ